MELDRSRILPRSVAVGTQQQAREKSLTTFQSRIAKGILARFSSILQSKPLQVPQQGGTHASTLEQAFLDWTHMQSGSPTNSASHANTHVAPPGLSSYSALDTDAFPGNSLTPSLSRGAFPFSSDTASKSQLPQTSSQSYISTTDFQLANDCESPIFGSENEMYDGNHLFPHTPIPSDQDWSSGTKTGLGISSPNSAPWSPGSHCHTQDQIIGYPWNSSTQFGTITGTPCREFRQIQGSGWGHSAAGGNNGISSLSSEQERVRFYEGELCTRSMWQFDVSCCTKQASARDSHTFPGNCVS